jgi:diguanylate cyclase (GGDEF)-like protein
MTPELLLWRWSTTAQILSAVVIAVFFVVMARSVRRVEIRPWVYAWLSNLLALLVTSVYWLGQPKSQVTFLAIRVGYFFGKTMFVVLLAVGAWGFVRHRSNTAMMRTAFAIVLVYSVVAAFVMDSIDRIGILQSALIALFLGTAAILLLVKRVPGAGWLAFGLAVRAGLGIVETLAYGTQVFPTQKWSGAQIKFFLASHSSLDTGAEWVIALGCVLVLYRTIQNELTQANARLTAAQEVLQELVDRDPLTGLSNRRALPDMMRGVVPTGATILFFDLNDFKGINDRYGHQMGDECLKRFARVLQASFRPEDRVVRYAGDEFVVIAQPAEPDEVIARIEGVRERLKFERSDGPPIRFAAGHTVLPINGDPDAAMRAADEAMYREKGAGQGRLRSL